MPRGRSSDRFSERKMTRSFGGAYKPEAVPKIAVTPVEREMQRMGQ